jgi:hypothetical protein
MFRVDAPVTTYRVALAVALLIAFTARAFRLTSLFPILVDESIYLRWAEIIDHQHQWFISLLDGKQPLSYWILAAIRMLFGGDPLVGGRLVSLTAGLLSTVAVYAAGRKLSGELAGILAALMYSVMPYAVFYERIAYTDALVNLFGIAVVYASFVHFGPAASGRWKSALLAGFVLGAGFFTKSSMVLFAFVPALACLLFDKTRWQSLGIIYGIAAVFPFVSFISVPVAPMFATTSLVLHRQQFFVPVSVLLADPFAGARINALLLIEYLWSYLTLPVLVAAIGAFLYLAWQRSKPALLLGSVFAVPLSLQVMALEYFPSRYAFPHVWPCLVLVALAAADLIERVKTHRCIAGMTFLLAGSLAVQSTGLVLIPQRYLHVDDAEQFLGSNPYAGWGVRDAVNYLRHESHKGPFVLLTDPYWGPPADAMFPYLNKQSGIEVHEAWWLQLSKSAPILPQAEMAVMKSHYERVKGGELDFRAIPRVFYVTDTGYASTAEVLNRQPDARRVASFKKPNGVDSVDVYRLK